METQILPATTSSILKAASALNAGELVAFPTETVYGLGASIFNETAIQKIFTVKGRPSDNPLIVHISSLAQVESIAKDLPSIFFTLSNNYFPGPLTLVVTKKDTVSDIASAHLPTIGIRMPDHPVALSLIDSVGSPIVAPSANLSGKPSPTTAQHVYEDMNGKIPFILDGGPCNVGIESTVLDLTVMPPTILRPGHVTQEELEKTLRQPIALSTMKSESVVKAPGMKYRHYAPNTPILIVNTVTEFNDTVKEFDSSILVLSNIPVPLLPNVIEVLPLTEKNLFAAFRHADKNNLNHILIFLDEETNKNKGLVNRIEKARQ